MDELKLYKLLVTEDNEYGQALADEIRWVSEDELLIWVPYMWIEEFMEQLVNIFGNYIFDDGGFDGNFQDGCVCIDLKQAIGWCTTNLKEIFPPDKYKD